MLKLQTAVGLNRQRRLRLRGLRISSHIFRPSGERAAQRTEALIELGKEVEKAAAAEKRPCTPIIYQGDDECRYNDQYWDDCLHFSPTGSDKLGQLVFTAITAAGL